MHQISLPNGEHVSTMFDSAGGTIIGTASGKMGAVNIPNSVVNVGDRISEHAIVGIEEIGLFLYLITDEKRNAWTWLLG